MEPAKYQQNYNNDSSAQDQSHTGKANEGLQSYSNSRDSYNDNVNYEQDYDHHNYESQRQQGNDKGMSHPNHHDGDMLGDKNDESQEAIQTLYISKLSFKTTQENLIDEFSKYGKVVNCHLVVDPHTKESRGFAFVTFETIENADNALEKCANLVLDGSQLVVEKSRRVRPRSPTPGRYSGNRPLYRQRFGGYSDRRSFYRPPGRDYDSHYQRRPYSRDYPPRDFYPRDRAPGYGSRFGDREPYGSMRGRDRPYPPRRDYYPRADAPYPPRDPREGPAPYARAERDFRGPMPPRDRFPEQPPRDREPRVPAPFERENAASREPRMPERYPEARTGPPYAAPREHRPRYQY